MVGLAEARFCHGMPYRAQSYEKNEPHGDHRFKKERGLQGKQAKRAAVRCVVGLQRSCFSSWVNVWTVGLGDSQPELPKSSRNRQTTDRDPSGFWLVIE